MVVKIRVPHIHSTDSTVFIGGIIKDTLSRVYTGGINCFDKLASLKPDSPLYLLDRAKNMKKAAYLALLAVLCHRIQLIERRPNES